VELVTYGKDENGGYGPQGRMRTRWSKSTPKCQTQSCIADYMTHLQPPDLNCAEGRDELVYQSLERILNPIYLRGRSTREDKDQSHQQEGREPADEDARNGMWLRQKP